MKITELTRQITYPTAQTTFVRKASKSQSDYQWVESVSSIFKRHNAKISIDSEDDLITVKNMEGIFELNDFLKLEELCKIERLIISDAKIGDNGISAIATCTNLKHLKSLILDFNGIGCEGARVISESSNFPDLKLLCLWFNRIRLEGVRYLTQSPILSNLHDLYIRFNSIGEEGKKICERWNIIRDVRIKEEGSVEALAKHLKESDDFEEEINSIFVQYSSNSNIIGAFIALSSSDLLTKKQQAIINTHFSANLLSWIEESEDLLY